MTLHIKPPIHTTAQPTDRDVLIHSHLVAALAHLAPGAATTKARRDIVRALAIVLGISMDEAITRFIQEAR